VIPRRIPFCDPVLMVEWGDDCWLGSMTVIGVRPMANAANRRLIDQGAPSKVIVGHRSVIGTHCTIYHNVVLGEDCRVGDHATIREGVRVGARSVIGTNVDIQYGCRIGSDVRVMNGAHITGGTVIGDGSFIGPGVMSANDKHVDLADYRDRGQTAPVIGARVMIGVGAILLPGIVIGDGAIIGAGAVVTKDVPDGATVIARGVKGAVPGQAEPAHAMYNGR